MSRKSSVTACSIEPDTMCAFGDVCELLGRIGGVSAAEANTPREYPSKLSDLLAAHMALMKGTPEAGELRAGEARIMRGARVAHVPPSASRVSPLMNELMEWLSETEEHPVIASCIFHYHMLYIHPFSDGNGRLARTWQTLILETWRPFLHGLAIEELVNERKDAYLDALEVADRRKDAGPFTLFMLGVIRDALEGLASSLPAQEAASPKAAAPKERLPEALERLLSSFGKKTLAGNDLMKSLGMSHRGTFRKNYLDPALKLGIAEMTQPDAPRSPTQKYRLTPSGRKALAELEEEN